MNKIEYGVAFIVVIGFLISIIGFFAQPYFEAKAYNKFRKPDQAQATYWDAFWSDLRITSE
jgi:hypothetical protein